MSLMLPEPYPFPSEAQYEQTINDINDEVFYDRGRIAATLVAYGGSSPNMKIFSAEALKRFSALDHIDRSTSEFTDANRAASNAACLGAIAGMMVGLRLHGAALMPAKLMGMMSYAQRDEIDDFYQDRVAGAEAIRKYGYEGFHALSQASQSAIGGWSEEVTVDPSAQDSFVIGAGLVFAAGKHLHKLHIQEYQRQQMKLLLESIHDLDIDASFARLFDNQ